MPDRTAVLYKLAKTAFESPPSGERLAPGVDVIRDALAVERVFLVYVQDRDFLTRGGISAEMLIIRGPWEHRIDDGVFAFVESATPALALMMEDELSASRAARQREQTAALADAAG